MNAIPQTNVNLGGSPRLVLHIEADSLPELMTAIDAVMGGLDPSRALLAALDAADPATGGLGAPSAAIHVHDHADADADVQKRPRGRPRKEDTVVATEPAAPTLPAEPPAPTLVSAPAPVDPLAAAMNAAPAAPTQPAPSALDAAMTSLSPADARKKGIEMVQAHFAVNPASLPAIQAVSQKYGVAQFADIPDTDAHRFLADITLLTNGTGQV